MVQAISSEEFFRNWKHALVSDFQQNGISATYDAHWVSEAAKIETNTSGISVVAFSMDDTLIAIGTGPDIHIYDASTSQHLQTTRGHAGEVTHLEFHPSGRKLVSVTSLRVSTEKGIKRETSLRVHDFDVPNQPMGHLEEAAKEAAAAAASVLSLSWSKEDVDAACLQQEIIKLISSAQMRADVRNGRALLGSVPHFDSRAFSNDGRALLYLPDRNDVIVLDVATLTERFRLSGHTDSIMWAETSPDDKIVATSSWDKTVRIWSMDSAETLHVLQGATNQSWAGAFSPDSELIAAGAGDKMVRIWNVGTGELLHTLSGFTGWIRGLSFSPDGLCLAAGAAGGTLRVFDLKSGECLQNWQIDVTDAGARSILEISRVQYTTRGDLFFKSTEGRIFGYSALKNLKWETISNTRSATFSISIDGSKIIAALGSSIRVWKID